MPGNLALPFTFGTVLAFAFVLAAGLALACDAAFCLGVAWLAAARFILLAGLFMALPLPFCNCLNASSSMACKFGGLALLSRDGVFS